MALGTVVISSINVAITFVIVALVVFLISRGFLPRDEEPAQTRLCPLSPRTELG